MTHNEENNRSSYVCLACGRDAVSPGCHGLSSGGDRGCSATRTNQQHQWHHRAATRWTSFTIIVSSLGFNGSAGNLNMTVNQGDTVRITFIYGDACPARLTTSWV